jgi:uncharacterized protein (TIGR02231 family)
VERLDGELRKLGVQARALRDAIDRAARASQLAGGLEGVAVALVSRELTDAAPNTKAWGAAFDADLAAREKAAAADGDARAKLRELERSMEDLRRKRVRLQAQSARRERTVEVVVACPAGARAVDVALTYLVGGASWSPAYEARADEAGSIVELRTFATVRQSTGEDWKGAKIILSTAVPRQDATPPEIAPLRLWAEERKPERKVIVRRDERYEHAEATGSSSTSTPSGGAPGPSLKAVAQGLSVQLEVPDPSDVPGDNSPARLFVGKAALKARFTLRAAPKLAPFAFRVADCTNSAPYPLLAGPLDAYRGAGLAARYPIERTAEGAPLHLTFGIDESVRVKRVVVEEIQRDKGFFGTTRRFRFGYRFEIQSYLARAAELEVQDHVPVSELDDVKVAFDAPTSDGYRAGADDGIVTWRLQLKPGEKRVVALAFHVDVPSSYDTGAM